MSTDEFMEKISSDLISQTKQYSGAGVYSEAIVRLVYWLCTTIAAFDPKPFIRTFENVLEELKQLRTRVQEQCDELESSTQAVEHQYKKDIADMQGAFQVRKWPDASMRIMTTHVYPRMFIMLMTAWKLVLATWVTLPSASVNNLRRLTSNDHVHLRVVISSSTLWNFKKATRSVLAYYVKVARKVNLR